MTVDAVPVEPVAKLYRWKPAPSQIEQALEAACDDPSEREFIDLVCSLPGVYAHPIGSDKEWYATTVVVECRDRVMQSEAATRDLLTIARRAGWELEDVGFAQSRLSFKPRGEL